MRKVIVSLTSTPANFHNLHNTVETLINQTVRPDRIVINAPKFYTRQDFNNDLFSTSLSTRFGCRGLVELNRCADYGSSTKFIGLLNIARSIEDEDVIIVLDDDIGYPEKMIETYLHFIDSGEPDTIYGICGSVIYGHNIVNPVTDNMADFNLMEGWGSYCLNKKMLTEDLSTVIHFPKMNRFSDDVFFSNMFANFKKKIMRTEDVNKESLKIFDFGQSSHQLHLNKDLGGGVGADGNEAKYCKAISFLIRKNLLDIPLTISDKKKILARDFFYDNSKHLNQNEESFVKSFASTTSQEDDMYNIIDMLDIERQKILKVNKLYRRVTGGQINKDDSVRLLNSASKKSYGDIALDINPNWSKTNKKIAFIFPHVVNLEGHGCQSRAYQALKFLLDEGAEVSIFSRGDISGHEWSNEALENLKDAGVKEVDVFYATNPYSPKNQWASHCVSKLEEQDFDFYYLHYTSIWEDYYINKLPKQKLVMEIHDNLDVNNNLYKMDHTTIDLGVIRTHHIQTTFPSKLNHFETTVCNSAVEREELKNCESEVVTVSNFVDLELKSNSYTGNAVFVASDNPFNCNGLKYLHLGSKIPIDLVGKIATKNGLRFIEGPINKNLKKVGFVDSLKDVYKRAAFSVCPLVIGTGSKVKIAESLCNGVPVVSMVDSGLSSDIIHGVNGFLCYNFKDFFSYCEKLHNDRALCAQMGENAKVLYKRQLKSSLNYDYVFETYF